LTQFKTVVRAKGALDQKTGRRFSTGPVTNGRPTVNYSYVSTNTPARAVGVQRKLELDHQVDMDAFSATYI
jgi:male germ cell-associated kinase